MAKKKDSLLAILVQRGAEVTAKVLGKTAEILSDEENQKKAKKVANDVSEQTEDAAKYIKKKIETLKEKKETPQPTKTTTTKSVTKKKPTAKKAPVKKTPTKSS